MIKPYQQPSRFVPVLNPLIKGLLHLGLPMGPMALLTVRGRRSGRERTTPVALIQYESNKYIVSVYGLSQWVRNLRVKPHAKLKHGWAWKNVSTSELLPMEAAPILKHAFKISPGFLKKYFDTTNESPIDDFERDAANHPVFRIEDERG